MGRDAAAGPQPDADDLLRARSPGGFVDEIAATSRNAIEAAAAPKTPAADRTIVSKTAGAADGRATDSDKEAPRSDRTPSPSARANASADCRRRCGSGSKAIASAASRSRDTPGTRAPREPRSRNCGGGPQTSAHSVAASP